MLDDLRYDNAEEAPLEQFTSTIWKNPTTHTARIKLYVGDGRTRKNGGKGTAYGLLEIPPGESRSVSSEYDEAIQTTRDGVVVGGLCPWLEKNGVEPRIDPRLIAKEELQTAKATAVAVGEQNAALEASLEAERSERRALADKLAEEQAARAAVEKRLAEERTAMEKRLAALEKAAKEGAKDAGAGGGNKSADDKGGSKG